MSRIIAHYPLVGCFDIAHKNGVNPDWRTINRDQADWMQTVSGSLKDLGVLSPYMDSIFGTKVEPVNAFLKEHGVDIQLDDLGGSGGVAMASVLDILGDWRWGAKRHSITSDGVVYDGVRINCLMYGYDHDFTLVVDARTENDDIVRVNMRMMDEPYQEDPEGFPCNVLMHLGNQRYLVSGHSRHQPRPVNAAFPMVDMDVTYNHNWLLGMSSRDDTSSLQIKQAIQQSRLKINEAGLRAQSAAAVGATRGMSPPLDIIIDRPFLLWLELCGEDRKPKTAYPVFSAYVGTESWKDPGSLK